MCGKKDGETDLLKDKEVMTRNFFFFFFKKRKLSGIQAVAEPRIFSRGVKLKNKCNEVLKGKKLFHKLTLIQQYCALFIIYSKLNYLLIHTHTHTHIYIYIYIMSLNSIMRQCKTHILHYSINDCHISILLKIQYILPHLITYRQIPNLVEFIYGY